MKKKKLCFFMALAMLFACTVALAAELPESPGQAPSEEPAEAAPASVYTTEELVSLSRYLRSVSYVAHNLSLDNEARAPMPELPAEPVPEAESAPETEPQASSDPVFLNATLRVTADVLNCRTEPTTEAALVCAFPEGATVSLLDRHEDWYQVCDNNFTGWCKAEYLTLVRNETYECEPYDYTEEDLYWLALAIYREAGSAWICDEHRILVGNVVMNRVRSDRFADTVYDVLHTPGQYPWTRYASLTQVELDEHFYDLARLIFEGTSLCPADVVFQAEFRQGSGVFRSFSDVHLNNTTYFCYI